jgi:plasmid stabilization system protein ParE
LSLKIRFHEAARDELRAGARWYEREREGLGEEFLAAVEQLVERVARGELPGLAAREESSSVRNVLLRRFPYAVYYEIRAEELLVWAVAHGRRRPGYWRTRT